MVRRFPITACQCQTVRRRRRTSAAFTLGVALAFRTGYAEVTFAGTFRCADDDASVEPAAVSIRTAASMESSSSFGFTAETPP